VKQASSSADALSPHDVDASRPAARRRWYGPILALPTPIIFVAAAALALWLLWRGGGLHGVADSLQDVNPVQVVGLLIVYAMSLLLLALRWHALVRMAGGSPSWASSAEVFLTSVIVNYAAPIGLAVPTRAALTIRDLGLKPGQSGAVVGWEAALDLLALVLVSAAWLVLGGLVLLQSIIIDERVLAAGATAIAVGAVIAAVLVRSTAIRSRIAPFTSRMISSPAEHPGLALLALVLTAGFWLLQIGVMAAIVEAFGTRATPMLLLGIMGLPVLIGMLSPVPGGAGVREALMAAVARLEGVPAGPVVLAAVAYRLALFVVTPLVWAVIRVVATSARRR
jgi:glycosyltransferase 2 family protein